MSVEDVRDRLDGLAEELADLAIEALRERDGDRERRYTRARRAVEKASHLLSDIPGADDD